MIDGKNLFCGFIDNESGYQCNKPAVSAVLLVLHDKCGYVCEKHANHILTSSAIERGDAKLISLEEAMVIEVMTS
ncbi:MAG: hypothetical protein WC708_00055 [Lentisphaeria bacterium]|jgi:hypothetical protein